MLNVKLIYQGNASMWTTIDNTNIVNKISLIWFIVHLAHNSGLFLKQCYVLEKEKTQMYHCNIKLLLLKCYSAGIFPLFIIWKEVHIIYGSETDGLVCAKYKHNL